MPTYNAAAVSDSAIAYEKPVLLQQGRALRDNPIAQSQGAAGAPYDHHFWHPYNGVLIGDGMTGAIYDFGTAGVVPNVVSPDFSDSYEYLFFIRGISSAGSVNAFQMELYRETTAAYAGAVALITVSTLPITSIHADVEVLRPRDVANACMVTAIGRDTGGTTGTGSSTVDGGIVYHATAQKILRARFRFDVANIDAGKIFMYRRLAF